MVVGGLEGRVGARHAQVDGGGDAEAGGDAARPGDGLPGRHVHGQAEDEAGERAGEFGAREQRRHPVPLVREEALVDGVVVLARLGALLFGRAQPGEVDGYAGRPGRVADAGDVALEGLEVEADLPGRQQVPVAGDEVADARRRVAEGEQREPLAMAMERPEALGALGKQEVAQGDPDPAHAHLPERHQRVVVAHRLAVELVEAAGGRDLHGVHPVLAHVEAEAVPPVQPGMDGRDTTARGRFRRARLGHGAPGAHDLAEVSPFVHMDDGVAQLRRVVAPELASGLGRDALHLAVVQADEGGRGQEVAVGRAVPVEPEVVDMAGEQGLDAVLLQEAQEPAAAGLAEVVVVLLLVRPREVGRVVAHEEEALAPAGGEVGLQPGPLLRLGGEARVEDLRVDDRDVAAVVVERPVLRPEVPFPQRQMRLGDPGGRRPVVGLVAHVVVAGREIERTPERGRLLVEARRRFGVEVRDGGHRMHEVAHVDDEGEVAGVEVADDVAQAAVGEAVGLVGRVARVLALVDVGVGDDAETEAPRAQGARVRGVAGHASGGGSAAPGSTAKASGPGPSVPTGRYGTVSSPGSPRDRAAFALPAQPRRENGPIRRGGDGRCPPSGAAFPLPARGVCCEIRSHRRRKGSEGPP